MARGERSAAILASEIKPGDIIALVADRSKSQRVYVTTLPGAVRAIKLSDVTLAIDGATIKLPPVDVVSVLDTTGGRHTYPRLTEMRRFERPAVWKPKEPTDGNA